MKKRILAVAVIISLTLLCGCSKTNDVQKETKNGQAGTSAEINTTSNSTDSTTSAEEEATSQEKTDYLAMTQPVIENGHYVFNLYSLSKEAIDTFGEDFAEFYVKVVDAYMSGETKIPCTNQDYADMLCIILPREMPAFEADTTVNNITDYDGEYITLHYANTVDEHKKLVEDIKNATNSYLESVSPDDSEQLKAEKVYNAMSKVMLYDYEGMNTRENIEAYYGMLNHTGVCVTFSNIYMFLLKQVGIECTLVSAMSGPDMEGHVFNLVKINGQNYFCDTTFEISETKGNGFIYFGETAENRINDGICKDWMSVGLYNVKDYTEIDIAKKPITIIPLS